jgi:hypothetical protein
MTFMQSEWHTTVEYARDNSWYVADPTFGFAFVADKTGHRLSTRELIEALDQRRESDLTFAVTRRGKLYGVPGKKFLEREAMLASVYYTRDKRIEFVAR